MRFYIKLLLVFCLALFQIACSQGPSDEEAKLLITSKLKQDFPANWVVEAKLGGVIGNLVSNTVKATNVEISSIEIKQRGDFNEQEKYWPVKAQVKGTFQREIVGNKVENKISFDREGNFHFAKDDYDSWKVSVAEN
jgi:hypothetical protein